MAVFDRTLAGRALAGAALVIAAGALTGCGGTGDVIIDQSVGISAVRSPCPAVGIPDYTGDITLFDQAGAQTAAALDVTAAMTNVRSSCDESGDRIYTNVTFDVLARRSDASGARSIDLPYFVTVLRGGGAVISKRVGTVTLNFADGQYRAQASGVAGAYVDRAEATLPEDIRERITRRREPGDADAAIDPLAEPEVRAALARATFEVLVGFQLDDSQLAYNATR